MLQKEMCYFKKKTHLLVFIERKCSVCKHSIQTGASILNDRNHEKCGLFTLFFLSVLFFSIDTLIFIHSLQIPFYYMYLAQI